MPVRVYVIAQVALVEPPKVPLLIRRAVPNPHVYRVKLATDTPAIIRNGVLIKLLFIPPRISTDLFPLLPVML